MSTLSPYSGKLPILSSEKIENQYDIDFTKNHIFNKIIGYTNEFLKEKYSNDQYPNSNVLIDCSNYCDFGSEFSFLTEIIGQTIAYLQNVEVSYFVELNDLWNTILNTKKHAWQIKEDIFKFYEKLIIFPNNIIYIIHDYHLIVNHISDIEFQILKRISVDKNIACFWFISDLDKLKSINDFEKEFHSSFRVYPNVNVDKEIFIPNFFKRLNNYSPDFTIEKIVSIDQFNYHINNFNKESIVFFDRIEISLFKKRVNSINTNLINYETMPNSQIFISYAWGDNSEENQDIDKIVDDIEKSFANDNYDIKRDKKDVKYKDSINDFETSLGEADFILLVISDKYLKSEHCMNEILQIENNGNFKIRILPIVLNCANIYKAEERIEYISYWDDRISNLNIKLKELDNHANTQGFQDSITLYSEIRRVIDRITSILKDMNALTPAIHKENNFTVIKDFIKSQLKNKKIAKQKKAISEEINQTGTNNVNVAINKGTINIKK